MSKFANLFVVYDPTREEQPALERAIGIALETSARLHLFACIFSDTAKSAEEACEVSRLLAEQRENFDKLAVSLSERGVDVTTEVEWDKDWYRAVVRASMKSSADLVLKSSYKHSSIKRKFSRTSDWTLIRECLCPVLLVKESAPPCPSRVLVAVDICAKKESYDRLNQNVISFGKRVLDNHSAEVHYINAFQYFEWVPDKQELIRNHGIESDKIHIRWGDPERVIVAQAKKLDARLVVVGNSARSGVSAAFLGNTVEKVLDKLECDVLSMR
jgi:universal stress protein E